MKHDEFIPIESLHKGILWAMKENLNVQILYPDYTISHAYKTVIDSIDHADIIGSDCEDKSLQPMADVVVFDNWTAVKTCEFVPNQSYVVRTSKVELFYNIENLTNLLKKADRTIVVITDIDSFSNQDFKQYEELLDDLIPIIKKEYAKGRSVQLNLLTDRMLLDKMNNCNAGAESITLAPDGKFYICPAFYHNGSESVGDLESGLNIKNPQLYRLDHATICRNCDAYQCRRCIWLNRKTTLEVNTPSHEQCVVAHIERNASKKLLDSIRELGGFLPDKSIEKINYLDPFEIITKN